MESLVKSNAIKAVFFTFLFCLISALVRAQYDSNTKNITSSTTKTSDINTTVNSSGEWYTQPWVWIVGAAVFILLLVALLSNDKKTERITVQKASDYDKRSGG